MRVLMEDLLSAHEAEAHQRRIVGVRFEFQEWRNWLWIECAEAQSAMQEIGSKGWQVLQWGQSLLSLS